MDTGINVASALRALPLDEDTGLLYWTAKADDGATALYCIDVAGKSCQKSVDFPNNEYVVSLRVVNDAVVSGAPVRVANLTAEFAGGELLRGIYRLPLPEKTVVGDFLNGNVEYTVSVNGKEHSKGAGTPGDHIFARYYSFGGHANISVVTANADGVGQEAKTSVYVGNDNPEAPSRCRAYSGRWHLYH